MAIFSHHVDIEKRSAGQSAVAAAAYRTGQEIRDERTGILHDYTRKIGVVYSEIMLPYNAPSKFMDRSILWNTVEKTEPRKDAQIARKIDVALPREFDGQEQIEVMRKYVGDDFVSLGMCADYSIHDNGDGNPHAHIMVTMRDVSESGLGNKNRDWNSKALLEKWRENWAKVCNEKFQEKGLDERIDHRTLEEQGINREPTIHMGVAATHMEKRGIKTERGEINREIMARNEILTHEPTPEATAEYIHELKEGYIIVDTEISAITDKIRAIEHEMRAEQVKAENINQCSTEIQSTRARMKELRGQSRKSRLPEQRKAIEAQIFQLLRKDTQGAGYFEREYLFVPEEAPTAIRKIESKVHELEQSLNTLRDRLPPFLVDREVFEREYRNQRLFADVDRDRERIFTRLEELEKEMKNRLSPKENLARLASVINLENAKNQHEHEKARERDYVHSR